MRGRIRECDLHGIRDLLKLVWHANEETNEQRPSHILTHYLSQLARPRADAFLHQRHELPRRHAILA